ncbi:hypothetical protein LNKW23_39710 [Paralimibaculum aggregatum]|uniref:Phytanoyl-CoA dioxygenase n=1 Tax=Paralimibaculum aggregatum TaxID=3036245 RepID=A0ABQ6LQC3_9RHOB|nr:hypothetical protein [Limibaculum sp. NKW23]GMG84755.1 hypothetical protein LNKW23_39710 [Limibaculum sp. NKW23]
MSQADTLPSAPFGAHARAFFTRGWTVFEPDPEIAAWVAAAAGPAARIAADPAARAAWLRCGGTWFAGVNIFPNGPDGAVPGEGVPPLSGAPLRFVAEVLGLAGFAWDRAQISVCHPGYPQPWEGESEAAFGYRLRRDAAHVDGLLRDAARRRTLGETHGFILGLPLGESHPQAAPFTVWEGSHALMRQAFRARFAGIAPGRWAAEDITDAYVAARRAVFERCRRVEIHARPGQAVLTHRLALHGVAPWTAPEGPPRAIAYFRPDPFPGAGPHWWLEKP